MRFAIFSNIFLFSLKNLSSFSFLVSSFMNILSVSKYLNHAEMKLTGRRNGLSLMKIAGRIGD